MMKKCDFCRGDHKDRDCPIEKRLAPFMRKQVGYWMEEFVGNNIKCPICGYNSIHILGDNSPSLDAICSNCNNNYEVKSKCLSVSNIPDDIVINHGNYFEYLNRKKQNLNFIIVIYSANRKNKSITIRKVFYVPSKNVNSGENFKVIQKNNSTLCNIFIKNHNLYKTYPIYRLNTTHNFSNEIQQKIDLINSS